jgi:hypothetical protein
VLAREFRFPGVLEGGREGAVTVNVGCRWKRKLWDSRVKSLWVGPVVEGVGFFFLEEEKGDIVGWFCVCMRRC